MSSFPLPLKYDKLSKKHFWHRQLYRFTAPFEYTTKSGKKIRIETGLVIDFASTPFWIRWRYPALGWYTIAVAIHDQGYSHHDDELKEWWDDVMVEIMEVLAHFLTGDIIPKKMQKDIDRFEWAMTTRFAQWAWNK